MFDTNSILQIIIKNQIIHEFCDKLNSYISCISNKKRNFDKIYNKNFPKAFQKKTKINTNNYFLYCRYNNRYIFVKYICNCNIQIDNQ